MNQPAAAKKFNGLVDSVTDTALPYAPWYGNNAFYKGKIDGRAIYQLETTEAWIAIAQMRRQMPEFNIDWEDAEVEHGYTDNHGYAGSIITEDWSQLVPAHWEVDGKSMDQEAMLIFLSEVAGCGETDSEVFERPPISLRTPFLSEIELATDNSLEIVIGQHMTTIGKHIELSDWGIFYYEESMHLHLDDAIKAMKNQASTEEASTFKPLETV